MKRFAALLAVYTFVATFVFVHAGTVFAAEIECAQFSEKGDVKTTQETVGKDVTSSQTQTFDLNAKEGSAKLKGIQQKSPWTHEEIKIKDGKMQIISTCGEKGKTGTITVCVMLPSGKEACGIKIPKDSEKSLLIDNALTAASDSNPTSAMQRLALGDRASLAAKLSSLDPNLLAGRRLNVTDEEWRRMGVPQEYVGKVQEATRENPEQTQQLLQAIAAGDTREVKAILDKNSLNLVADTDIIARNAVRMYADPAKLASALPTEARSLMLRSEYFCGFGTPCPESETPPTMRPPAAGFDEPPTPSSESKERAAPSASVAEKVSGLVDELTGHGCQNDNLSCRTNNPGAMRYANWMQKYGGFSCGQPNDTACFPTIEAGIAAKADLVTRRINQGCDTLYTILEDCRYSSMRDGNDSYSYAVTVGSKTGVGAHGKLDPQNSEQMARLLTGMAWYEGGRGIGFTAGQLERGLKAYYGTDTLPAGDPNFTPGTSLRSLAAGGGLRVGVGQFFENTFGGGSGLFSGSGNLFGGSGGLLSSLFGLFSSQTPVTFLPTTPMSPLPPTATEQLPLPTTPIRPVAKLISYPKEVQKGNAVIVIWSSAGVSNDAVCALYEIEGGERTLRQARNAGTYTKHVPATFGAPHVVFSLECTPADSRVPKSEAAARLEIPVR